MTMCTVKEIQEAIREDCKSQHDMDSTDIDRVMQTLPFAQEEPFTEARPRKPENMPILEDLYNLLREQEEKEAQYVVRQINRCFSLQIKTDILMLNAA